MAKLTAASKSHTKDKIMLQHPLQSHPLMPPSSATENEKVILPFSRRVIDKDDASVNTSGLKKTDYHRDQMIISHVATKTSSRASTTTAVVVSKAPRGQHNEEGRRAALEQMPNKSSSSSSTSIQPTNRSSSTRTAQPTTTITTTSTNTVQTNNKQDDVVNQLPRSIRWRLSLGLLTMPNINTTTDRNNNNTTSATATTTTTATTTAAVNTTANDNKKSTTLHGTTLPAIDVIYNCPSHLNPSSTTTTTTTTNIGNKNKESSSSSSLLLRYIEDTNALKLRCQRSRYEELEQKHYYSNTVMGIADSSSCSSHNVESSSSSAAAATGGAAAGGEYHHQQHQQHQQQHFSTEGAAVSPISSLVGNKMHHVAPGDDPLSALLTAADNNNNNNNNNNSNMNKGMFGFGNRKKKLHHQQQQQQSTTIPSLSSSLNTSKDKNINVEDADHHITNSNNNINTTTTTTINNNNRRSSDTSNTSNISNTTTTENNKETACKGSRWADYYSTREVLDVIEKDLNRLPTDHYTIYHEWKRYNNDELIRNQLFESGGSGSSSANNMEISSSPSLSSASLSAYSPTTKKGELKVGGMRQKNRFGNSFKLKDSFNFGNNDNNNNNMSSLGGSGSGGDKNAFWSNLISKDDDEEEILDPISSTDVSRKERADRLSRLLFVYAREHPEIGYRQGMHETLSFILLALEMDLLEQSVQREKSNWRSDIMEIRQSSITSGGGGMAGVDSSGQIVVVRLLDQNYLVHDAFALFECVMSALAPAYDAIPAGEDATTAILEKAKMERGESPMEAMVSKIMSKIRFVARDEALFGMVLCMPVPPQIYFAKWVRLMFGREVSGGMKNVMRLWDAFFDLAAKMEHREEEITISLALMNVLETAAASMIILIRDKLLKPSMARDGTLTADPDPNEGIGYLMNYPPIEDIGHIINVISSLLLKERSLSQIYDRRISQEEEEHHTRKVDDPFGTGTGRMNNQHRPQQVAPLSPDTPDIIATRQQLHAPHPKIDVAESIGNFAAGLLDIGSRTVDAAISTYQKHQAEKQHHQKNVFEHPLQFGFNAPPPPARTSRDGTRLGIGRNDDTYAVTYRNHADAQRLEGENNIVYNTDLRYSQKDEPQESTRAMSTSYNNIKENTSGTASEFHRSDSDLASPRGKKLGLNHDDADEASTASICIDQLENGDDTMRRTPSQNRRRGDSLSASRNLNASLRKSPKSLARKLDKSVKTLMRHFEQQQQQQNMMENLSTSAGATMIIPEEIWEAMAAIDSVKKELLTQDALATLEKSAESRLMMDYHDKLEKKM